MHPRDEAASSRHGDSSLRVGIASVPNLRDVGGHVTRDGAVVRTGLVYRANELHPVSAEDMEQLAALGLKYDFDLRTAAEAAAHPDQLPAGVERVWLDVFADGVRAEPNLLDSLLANPLEANTRVGGGRIDALLERVYRAFVSLSSARQAYGRLFSSLAEPGHLPALFHCTAGKDRTGWAAAALLTLLGVSTDVVVEDYLRSNDYMLPHYRPVMDAFVAGGGEPAIVDAIFGVKADFLDSAFREMEALHGTVEHYFADGLGIDERAQEALRTILLEA